MQGIEIGNGIDTATEDAWIVGWWIIDHDQTDEDGEPLLVDSGLVAADDPQDETACDRAMERAHRHAVAVLGHDDFWMTPIARRNVESLHV